MVDEGGGGEARGWRGSGTRMLMRVRRRKEEERENIDLRQENRRECNTGGPLPCVNYNQKRGGGIRQSIIVRTHLRISVCFFAPVYPPVREEDTPKERGEDAVIRYLQQGCRGRDGGERERQGGGGLRYAKDGCFARSARFTPKYCENAAAVR